MVMPNFRFGNGGSFVVPSVFIAPNNAAFGTSDFFGTITQDSGKIRFTRLVVDGQGFEHSTPNARVRFNVTLPTTGQVNVRLNFTSLVTRLDTYNSVGSIFVNGVISTDFAGPATHVSGTPHPAGTVISAIILTAGTHLVEVIMPYCASVDFTGIDIPVGASIATPTARVSKRGVFFGDSITHGFSSTRIRSHWPSLVAATEASQIINYGYGGRQLAPSDGTNAGNVGADFAVYLIGFNDFYPNGASTTTFKNNYKTLLGNFRTASTTAGKPVAPFYALTPFDAPSAYGGGGYAGNSPTIEAFRQAIRDAVTEQADPYVTIIEGLGAGMPTGSGNFPDGVHPNDTASATIATIIAGLIP
jgi:lysophospholipase L1-like esterase